MNTYKSILFLAKDGVQMLDLEFYSFFEDMLIGSADCFGSF